MANQFLTKRIFPAGFAHAALVAFVACCISAPLAQAQRIKIANNTPGFIRHAVDLGPTDPTTDISATVWLQLHNEAQLEELVKQQNQKGNANYHQWITQAQFNSMFGAKAQEVNAVTNYLSAKGLTLLTVAENNMYVKVEGTVAQMQKAFGVQIHNYNLNGQIHRSNTADPSVNDASGAHVAAVSGLDDLEFQPAIAFPGSADAATFKTRPLTSGSNGFFFESQCLRLPETQNFTQGTTSATYTGNRYGADITNSAMGHLPPCGYQPSELYTAYNMNPLYKAGLNGAGETVVITDAFGSPTITSDAQAFSGLYNLPGITPDNFQILRAPGAVHNPGKGHFGGTAGWMIEISLDVEYVHAMAPGAKIVLVIGPNNGADLDEAVNYAVVHHLGNTITNSWGAPEGFGNPAHFIRDTRILEMAAAQGMDVNFSSGDSGDFSTAIGFKSVNFPGSSPFATSIGGTSLFLKPDDTIDLQMGWGNNLTRIADTVAAGSPPQNPPLELGFQGGAGGGASLTFARPAFQSGLSVAGNTRLVPDVSWLADAFTGVEIVFQNGVGTIGGTSLASPMFSSLMAIAAQKNGHAGLGQAAPLVYGLSSSNSTSTAIYDVVPVGSPNNVTGSITTPSGTITETADDLAQPLFNTTTYFSALYNSPFSTRWFTITFGTDTSLTVAPGWDDVTGVGTPNGANFVNELVK